MPEIKREKVELQQNVDENSKPDSIIMDKLTQAHTTVDDVAEKLKQVEIDQSKLTALSPEVISRQATVSLGCLQRFRGKS